MLAPELTYSHHILREGCVFKVLNMQASSLRMHPELWFGLDPGKFTNDVYGVKRAPALNTAVR
jgi:hypothetical protein